MCGASQESKDIEHSQANFYKEMTSEYSTVFGENQAILGALTKSFQPILDAGINQEGFSKPELTNLQGQATTGTGQIYSKAAGALAKAQGAEGGGTTYIPSGADRQQQLQLATSAAQTESGMQSNILAEDYATGRQNYMEAANVLGGVAGQYNPAGFANSATGAGSAASTTANEITQAGQSWMGLVSGALGAAGTAAAGCWIAAACFDGWDDPRTHAVRAYLFGPFRQKWYGRIITNLYLKYGERTARQPILVSLLRPLFQRIYDFSR